jgi:hypothetical protein
MTNYFMIEETFFCAPTRSSFICARLLLANASHAQTLIAFGSMFGAQRLMLIAIYLNAEKGRSPVGKRLVYRLERRAREDN